MELREERLKALPVQVLEIDGGVVLKRGRVEMKIRGEGAAEALRRLLEATAGEGMTRGDLLALSPEPEQPLLASLIDHLARRRLLVPASGEPPAEAAESSADVFYWHFGQSRPEVAGRLSEKRLLVLGVNRISRQLAVSLAACGAGPVTVVDDPLLRNLELFAGDGSLKPGAWPAELPPPSPYRSDADSIDPESVDCLVAASDHGAVSRLRRLNEICNLHRLPFLPVMLRDLVGSVGPLVVPGETACFECLLRRERTHVTDPAVRQMLDEADGGEPAAVGFLPPMASTTGDVAALELVRFFGMGPPLWRVGSVVEVNLLGRDVTARKVLRLPRCPVCTALEKRPSLAVHRHSTLLVLEGGS